MDTCNFDDGWHDIDGMCFKYFDEDRSWQDAKTHCESQKATLAILNSPSKLDIFSEVVQCKDYSKGVWIGLSDTVGKDMVKQLKTWAVVIKSKISQWYTSYCHINKTCFATVRSYSVIALLAYISIHVFLHLYMYVRHA